jgi:hypothetical protein
MGDRLYPSLAVLFEFGGVWIDAATFVNNGSFVEKMLVEASVTVSVRSSRYHF